jgi:hypothetical protein
MIQRNSHTKQLNKEFGVYTVRCQRQGVLWRKYLFIWDFQKREHGLLVKAILGIMTISRRNGDLVPRIHHAMSFEQ